MVVLFRKTARRRRCHQATRLRENVFQIGCEPLVDVSLELVHVVRVVRVAVLCRVAATAAAWRRATLCPRWRRRHYWFAITSQEHLTKLGRCSRPRRRMIGSAAVTRVVHVGRWWSVRCRITWRWRVWIPCGSIWPAFVAVATRSWRGPCRSVAVGMLLLLAVMFGGGCRPVQVIKHALNSLFLYLFCFSCYADRISIINFCNCFFQFLFKAVPESCDDLYWSAAWGAVQLTEVGILIISSSLVGGPAPFKWPVRAAKVAAVPPAGKSPVSEPIPSPEIPPISERKKGMMKHKWKLLLISSTSWHIEFKKKLKKKKN